eukprot:scaffold16746_cov137-Isochrysis_galbana.AAC.2
MEKHGLKGDAGYAQAQARRPRPESEHRRAAKRWRDGRMQSRGAPPSPHGLHTPTLFPPARASHPRPFLLLPEGRMPSGFTSLRAPLSRRHRLQICRCRPFPLTACAIPELASTPAGAGVPDGARQRCRRHGGSGRGHGSPVRARGHQLA